MKPRKPAVLPKKLAGGMLILFFAVTLVAESQERTGVPPPDTSENTPQSFHPRSLFFGLSLLHPQLPGLFSQPFSRQSQLNFWTVQDKLDLVSPWKLELANQEEYRTMRTILQSIEVGGVAYIGYQHIKKYGLK